MDLKQLNYFIAVAETGHLGRAAERLHVSQPPLTRQIQLLEEELETVLFQRTPRGMDLTQAGAALLDDARALRMLATQAKQRVRRAGRGELGRLDIGVYGTAMFGVLPRLLQAFHQRHPNVDLSLHQAQTPAQVIALRQRRVIAVFERLLPDDEDIVVEPVAEEQVWLAVSQSHPLASLDEVDVEALRGHTIVTGNSTTEIASVIEMCRSHGFEPRLAPPMSDLVVAALLASSTSAVALVPDSMLNVQFPGGVYRRLKATVNATRSVHVLYLRSERSPLLGSLLEVVRQFRAEGSGQKDVPDSILRP